MAIYYRRIEDQIIVSGKTYPYRDAIRALGGRFQNTAKVWHLDDTEEVLHEIARLCKSVGGGKLKDEEPKRAAASSQPAPEPSLPASTPLEMPLALKDGLTVTELMTKAQLALTGAFPKAVWVLGEIQNLAIRAKACYFEIADVKEGASQSATMTVKATLWSSTHDQLLVKHGKATLPQILQDGLKVRILCQVGLYRDRGQITLNVLDIDPAFTRGSLALQREMLLKELRAKGLDQKNKHLTLPAFPLRIGLVSAEGSRAKSDFLDQLLTYGFPGQVIFYPAQMQGEGTLKEVVAAMSALEKAECDVIVLTRGGGSAADLRWFDSKEIAYAIAGSRVPVLAAIGHHEDTCVAEEIAFRREKTPTAAADFLLQVVRSTRERLAHNAKALSHLLDRWVEREERLHRTLKDRLYGTSRTAIERANFRMMREAARLTAVFRDRLASTERLLDRLRQRIDEQSKRATEERRSVLRQTANRLREATQRRLFQQEEQWLGLRGTLVSLDPTPWLEKGWTQLVTRTGVRVRRAADVAVGEELSARLRDALLKVKVQTVESKTEESTK